MRTMDSSVNQMNTKLILNTDAATASLINNLYDKGVIADFSEDGWVLFNKEWYPIETFIERKMNEHL
jgi:hypothetical protein